VLCFLVFKKSWELRANSEKLGSKIKVVWEGNHFVFLIFGLGGKGFEIFIVYKNEIVHYYLILSHVKPYKFKLKIQNSLIF